jgi:hypothetical protein
LRIVQPNISSPGVANASAETQISTTAAWKVLVYPIYLI